MFFKIIDGMIAFSQKTLEVMVTILGVYAFYEIVFNMDIPIAFSAFLTLTIVGASYFATAEEKKTEAVPVMIVKDGKAANVSTLGGG